MLGTNTFAYSRERRRFGRQCAFTDRNMLMLSINPSSRLRLQYILRNPVHEGTQLSVQQAFSEMETENVPLTEHGMYHFEGGWPKEVNLRDEESTTRHRKKVERDDNWGVQVLGLIHQSLEKADENSAMNIYQEFFIEMPKEVGEDIKARFESRQKNIFHDIVATRRPISIIDWTPNDVDKFMVLHTNIPLKRELPDDLVRKLKAADRNKKSIPTLPTPAPKPRSKQKPPETNNFYVWNMENPLKPVVTLNCEEKVLISFYCPKDDMWIAGGLYSGKICIWEARGGNLPVVTCPLEAAHREPTSALCWVHSKTNTEFYSGSYDGSVKYWDGRDLDKPLQEILLDPELTDEQSRPRSHGVTVLEFEYTIPIRFIIGSDMGSIFVGNRKGMSPLETLAAGNYRLFEGPIRTVERNPFFVKNFLITGDWCAKIWAEECKGSPTTLLIKKKNQILCGSWSTTRCSLFVTGDMQGELDFWDLLLHHRQPIFSMKFSSRVLYVKFRPDGEFISVCLGNGDIQILELDDALKRSTSKDKALIAALFERELLRCKFLEGRVEEIKLRHRLTVSAIDTKPEDAKKDVVPDLNPDDPDDFIRILTSDTEFRKILHSFQDQTRKVEKKRQERVYVMEETDFELLEKPPAPPKPPTPQEITMQKSMQEVEEEE